MLFMKVPEAKTVKNRVHLDLQSGGGPEVPLEEQQRKVRAEVTRLQALGAALVEERSEMGVTWAVMTDPEGNEFCA
jgi:heme oxygenase